MNVDGFPAYGHGPFERIGIETSIPLLVGFLAVCAAEVALALILWAGAAYAAAARVGAHCLAALGLTPRQESASKSGLLSAHRGSRTRTMQAYAHQQVFRMLLRSRSQHSRRRRLDRRSGYGAGYGCESLMIRDSRRWVCRQARGRTLELGVGTGLNFRWYQGDVELVAVDLDRECLEVSAERAHELGRAVRLAVADGHRLPFEQHTFETVVCTLAICDVDDRAATLAEVYRVVRPGGSLLLLDHLEPRWRHGRPAKLGERAGFTVVERERLWAGYFERVRLSKPEE